MSARRRRVAKICTGTAGTLTSLSVAGRLCAGLLVITVSTRLGIQPASGVGPVGPACGATISHDLTLQRDLTNCHGVGLVIDANDVTIDLNGHTVGGDGESDYEGIQVIGHRAVTIMNGAIRRFVEGVVVIDSRDVTVRGVTVNDERHVGVFVDGSSRVHVTTSHFADISYAGVFVTRSHGLDIDSNLVTSSGSGVAVRRTESARIIGNLVRGVECGGVQVYDDSDHNTVASNTVTGSGCDGISVWSGSRDNRVIRNVVRRNEGGIGVGGASENVVVANTASDNGFVGIYLFGADDNVVARNVVTGNGDGTEGGIHLLADDSGDPPERNVVRRNLVAHNTGDGILVDRPSAATALQSNIVVASSEDGIHVESARTGVTRNVADVNAALGIFAVGGVVDGGGNRAHGNGDPAQCVHVSCR